MAPTSKPIRSSPSEKPEQPPEEERDEIDELDNEPEMERPRLSLPIEEEVEEAEGSPEMHPPRLSLIFDEEDITVEYPRRATDAGGKGRLSMMSYGGGRLSENFGELTRLESGSEGGDYAGVHSDAEEGVDDTIISQGAFEKG